MELGPDGGTVKFPDEGELVFPSRSLTNKAKITVRSLVVATANGVYRYHPYDQPIEISARRSDTSASIGKLDVPAVVRFKLDRRDIIKGSVKRPAIRVLKGTDWERGNFTCDSSSMTLSVSISQLPVTLAAVDESEPPSDGEWDPNDPAAFQFSDGRWGVASVDASSPAKVLYRRSLGNQEPVYWLDWVTVDSAGDSPALVQLGSTLALFFRSVTIGQVKQVKMRTSTDDLGASNTDQQRDS